MIWAMATRGVPVGAVGVQALFDGEIDASTVKHRLDVLSEVRLPVYITSFSITNVDPLKHAYELEKFLRVAFSHPAVAGITLDDLWDKSAARKGSGLYAEDKARKPASRPEPAPHHPDPHPEPDRHTSPKPNPTPTLGCKRNP